MACVFIIFHRIANIVARSVGKMVARKYVAFQAELFCPDVLLGSSHFCPGGAPTGRKQSCSTGMPDTEQVGTGIDLVRVVGIPEFLFYVSLWM